MQSLDRHSGVLRVLRRALADRQWSVAAMARRKRPFFCNEFCADDSEEASFQSRGSTGGEARNSFGVTRAR
jgi:hypothetical protein